MAMKIAFEESIKALVESVKELVSTKADKTAATTSSDGLMSATDKAKLDGIADGAQVNAVTSVAGRTGAVVLTRSDVGLGNVTNYDQSTAIKSISRSGTTYTATRLDGTTFTFTQQDNNTTYSNATTSASGLMSASDKSTLNSLSTLADALGLSVVNGKVCQTYKK